MQFLADYKDGKHTVECVDCVQTLYLSVNGVSDQEMSDVVNKHAFLSHGAKAYASIHLTPASTEERPHLRNISLAFTPAKLPEAEEVVDVPLIADDLVTDEGEEDEEE